MTTVIKVKPSAAADNLPHRSMFSHDYDRTQRDGPAAILWERDPRHPGGEVFLKAGDPAISVWESPRVKALIVDGLLERVN